MHHQRREKYLKKIIQNHMRKLSMIAMIALVLGSIGTISSAATGTGKGVHEGMIVGNEGEGNVDELGIDKIAKLQMQGIEKSAKLIDKIVIARVDGDIDKVARLETKLAELQVKTAEKIADAIEEEHEEALEDLGIED